MGLNNPKTQNQNQNLFRRVISSQSLIKAKKLKTQRKQFESDPAAGAATLFKVQHNGTFLTVKSNFVKHKTIKIKNDFFIIVLIFDTI